MSLSYYNTLGRSGLKVSPLCLGTMTFGEDWGWGSSEDTARQIFQAYIKAGGNFIDTADGYTNGSSETLVGKFIQAEKLRDSVVLATKYTFCGHGERVRHGNLPVEPAGQRSIEWKVQKGGLRQRWQIGHDSEFTE